MMRPYLCRTLFFRVILFSISLNVTRSYSFKNCIESPASNRTTFKCYKRQVQSISAIVDDIPPSAKNLTIFYCKLLHIPSKSFKRQPELNFLQLSNNGIRSIDKDAFVKLKQLQTLNLTSNSLTSLHPQIFHELHSLTGLLLADNRLSNLSFDLFSNLGNLTNLDLRRNHLKDFSTVVDTVTNLRMLQKLDLSFNKIISLNHSAKLPKSLTTLYLSNNALCRLTCEKNFLSDVKVLDLSYNKLLSTRHFYGLNLSSVTYFRLRSTMISVLKLLKHTNVPAWHIDFSGLNIKGDQLKELCQKLRDGQTQISRLVLQNNGLEKITGMFSSCPQITKTLDISFNNLKNTECLQFLGQQKQLQTFKLEHNHLTKLLNCSFSKFTFPKLTNLSYRYNRILQVDAYAFNNTPKLTTLQLNINIIAYLDHKALFGLEDLTTLRLDNNLLTDLYEDSFKNLKSLQILNLRNNQIAVIFNNTFQDLRNLIKLDLGGNKINHLCPQAFRGLTSLANLYLDRNHLSEIDSYQIGRLHATLQVLDLQANQIHYFTEHMHSPFINLTKLTDLKLDSQVPYGISLLPHAFFRGLTSLKSLYLSNNHISYFSADTFDDLKNLTFLTLDNSCVGVTQLKPGIFKNLRKLEKLQVENMGIQNFSKEVFGNLTSLKVLHLNRNAMQTLDIHLLENLTNLQYLDIRNSPLNCHCPNSQLQNWTKTNQRVQLVYLYNMMCPNIKGSNFYNFDTNVCVMHYEIYFFVSTWFATLFFCLLPLLHVKLYWKCKYGYYVFRSWFGEQWRQFREEEEKCQYDAFISYNSADEKWVIEQLLPNLEDNGFRLCLHHRNFEPGRDIVDNIVSAVYNSRKTVCVVSQSFLHSEWCSLEIQLASYRLFDEMRDVLVLVFLESIPEHQLSTYHRMRKVMLKKTYLQWPGIDCSDPGKAQELFWKQLRRALRSSNSWDKDEGDREYQKDAARLEENQDLLNKSLTVNEDFYLAP